MLSAQVFVSVTVICILHVVSEQLNPQSPEEKARNGAAERTNYDDTATSVSSADKPLV